MAREMIDALLREAFNREYMLSIGRWHSACREQADALIEFQSGLGLIAGQNALIDAPGGDRGTATACLCQSFRARTVLD